MARSLLRTASWIAAGVAAGSVAARVLGRREAIAAVAPELRSPILHLPMDVTNERVLGLARKGIARPTAIAPGVSVRTERVPASSASGSDGSPTGVRVLVYEAADRARPSGALVWIHGGGTVMGVPEQAHESASRMAAEVGVLVVSVDYRLAPEHPFPAAVEDAYAALEWVAAQAEALGVDLTRIAVGGDSAGGLLAASLAQVARERGGPAIAFQALVYPMLDDRTTEAPVERTPFVWTAPSNRYAWTAYLGAPAGSASIPSIGDASAAPARTEDLAGLPPAWIGVGDLDLFLEEDLAYAARLEAAGVACEVHLEPGMYHGADAIFPGRTSMRHFRERLDDALRAAIGTPAGADAPG